MKNKKTSILAFMLVIFAFFGLGFEGAKGNVHVIPIEGEINRGTYKFVENSLAEIPDFDTWKHINNHYRRCLVVFLCQLFTFILCCVVVCSII